MPKENIILLNQLGTHRPNSRAELEKMLTKEVVKNYRVLNAEPENREAHVQFGTTRDGTPALINRHAVEADLRIVTGFIEPLVKELPMEYAVEMNRLIELQMEGSVG